MTNLSLIVNKIVKNQEIKSLFEQRGYVDRLIDIAVDYYPTVSYCKLRSAVEMAIAIWDEN